MPLAIRAGNAGKGLVVLDKVWSRATDAHLAPQHVQKLRQFVQTGAAKETSKRINARVVARCLVCNPIRRLFPTAFGGMDFAPFIAMLALFFIKLFVVESLRGIAIRLG